MTIPFEKLKARLLANPRVKAEYDALAPEFEISAELLRVGERPDTAEHQDSFAIRRGDGQQVPRAAFSGVKRHMRSLWQQFRPNPGLAGPEL